eukprot:TRINITY_DN5629_c0_g1_i1.p1 TRINITY_DN5629_c0_g1~~TRINITY_DN5629_c0_g1_i1.p1  ORF type:complete len:312 (-),score=61.59 TRINITY_DN5629_c0_g1_i1:75-947(-)
MQKTGEKTTKDVEKITLFRQPILTLKYFFIVIFLYFKESIAYLQSKKLFTHILLPVILFFIALYFAPGSHQEWVQPAEEFTLLCLWWIGLGVLSSIGLGTGLHTFVLYLGPHIASVTLTATECNTMDFETSGPNGFLCPDDVAGGAAVAATAVTIWAIARKVQFVSFLWGAGTALGELPPYFVARAARLTGENLEELETELMQSTGEVPVNGSFFERTSQKVKKMSLSILENLGFVGILLFASIPNPLFDLAGLMCGHFSCSFPHLFWCHSYWKGCHQSSHSDVVCDYFV